MSFKTEISVNGILASTSATATIEDPCRDHPANFGYAADEGPEDCTDEVYDALQDAWESRGAGQDSVSITLHGDCFQLSLS